MDGTVKRGVWVECRAGPADAAGANPATLHAGQTAVRPGRPRRRQKTLSRPRRKAGSATPAAVGTAAFLLVAGAWAATDGFLLDSALTSCLLTVMGRPSRVVHRAGGSLQGRDCIDALRERKPLHISHRKARTPPARMRAGQRQSDVSKKPSGFLTKVHKGS